MCSGRPSRAGNNYLIKLDGPCVIVSRRRHSLVQEGQ